MNYKISFLPELESDIKSAFKWYETKSTGLGYEFIRSFYASVYEVQRNPNAFQKVHYDFRRKLLKRFPYAMYYQTDEHEIMVYALFHTARDPVGVEDSLTKM